MSTPEKERTRLIENMKYRVEEAKQEIQEFAENLSRVEGEEGRNPGVILRWGESTFDAAASFHVHTQVLHVLEGGGTGQSIIDRAKENVLHMAQSRESSTSILSNLWDRLLLAKWATLLDRMEHRFERLDEAEK